MNMIIDYLCDIGLDVVKDRIKDSSMEAAARDRLKKYLERQKKVNEVCTREEEIDFEGLAKYIQEEMIEDVKLRLLGETEDRASAHLSIQQKAAVYAQSKTNLSKKRVQKMINDSLDILRGYYRSKVNRELLFIAAEIEESFSTKIDVAETILSEKIGKVEAKVESASLLSLDANVALTKAGNLSQVESNLSTVLKAISSAHTLYPYYGYKMEGQDNLVSIPLTEDAAKLYPPRFNVTASSVRLGDEVINSLDNDVLSRSYRHQLPLSMDVVSAQKFLGDFLDPSQKEAEQLAGTHVIMTPPPFPPAFACVFSVDGVVFFEYVLLRTKEILDDGTVIITNEEQNDTPFEISLSYNDRSKQFAFAIHLHSPSNNDLLMYYRFITSMTNGGELQIKMLSNNNVIISGPVSASDGANYSFEVRFLEMVVKIEEAFGCQFELPKEISNKEIETIEHLYSLLETGGYEGRWGEMGFEFIVTSATKQRVSELIDANYTLWYRCAAPIELFGKNLQIKILREIKCAHICELEKTKRKAEVLDEGDLITIKYVPGNDKEPGVYYDYIDPEENKGSVVYTDIEQ